MMEWFYYLDHSENTRLIDWWSGVHERGDAVPRPVGRRRSADSGVGRRAARLSVVGRRRLSRLAAPAHHRLYTAPTARPHHRRRDRRLARQMSRRMQRTRVAGLF